MEQHVHAVGVGARGGRECVGDGEDAVEVGADEVPDALGLQEIVVEGAVKTSDLSVICPKEGGTVGTYSADRAYVPSRMRFCTSLPKPADRLWAYTFAVFVLSEPGGGSLYRPVVDEG